MFTRVLAVLLLFGAIVLSSISHATEFVEIHTDKAISQYVKDDKASISVFQKYKPVGIHQHVSIEATFPDEEHPVTFVKLGAINYFVTPPLAAGNSRLTVKVYFEEDYVSPVIPPGKRTLVETKVVNFNISGPPVILPPVASLTATPDNGEAPVEVTLDASGSSDPQGENLIYQFEFGDGSLSAPSSSPSITHVYQDGGTYTATVSVSNSSGLSSISTAMISVAPNPATYQPVANLVVTMGSAPLQIIADASGSTDPQGLRLFYNFDFGDGTVENPNQPIVSHQYSFGGFYFVKLTVMNMAGHYTITSVPVMVIDVPTPQPPSAVASISPQNGTAPLLVSIDASGSSDPQGLNLSYSYDFGDGTQSSNSISSTTHLYTQPGTYTVVVTVKNSADLTSTASGVVVVGQPSTGPSPISDVNLTNLGITESNKFASLSSVPTLHAVDGTFSLVPEDFAILFNGEVLANTEFVISLSDIQILKGSKSGKNIIEFVGHDSAANVVRKTFTFWAGDKTVSGSVDAGVMTVRSFVAGMPEVYQEVQSASDGSFQITNLPTNQTIQYEAYNGSTRASKALGSGESSVILTTRAFEVPTVENLSIGADLSGWDISSDTVSIAPNDVDISVFKKDPIKKIGFKERAKRRHSLAAVHPKAAPNIPCTSGTCTVVLQTAGVGEKSTHHTFTAATANPKIRYRFKSLEVFNGYYKTGYNDSYRIAYKTSGGKFGEVTGSMNSIGRAGFKSTSATDWMELNTDIAVGETVEISAAVNNIGDDLYDSLLQLDFNAISTFKVESSFDDITGISTGEHPYLGGHSVVQAKVKVTGQPGDMIDSLSLRVKVEGQEVVTTILDQSPTLVGAVLDSTGVLESTVNFEIQSTTGLYIPDDAEVNLQLISASHGVEAQSIPSSTSTYEAKTWPALISLYASTHHAPGTEPNYLGTGFDWVSPNVKSSVEYIGENYAQFREISKMNGGSLSGFSLHENGNVVSFSSEWYLLGQDTTEAAATSNSAARTLAASRLIAMIHDPVVGLKIKLIWADDRFYKSSGSQADPFWIAILSDPLGAQLVKPAANHASIFDVLF